MTNHAQEALDWLEYSSNLNPDVDNKASHATQLAVAHATLELAEQQRIANLVALAELGDRVLGGYAGDAGMFATIFDKPTTQHGNVSVKPEIAAALGITEGKS